MLFTDYNRIHRHRDATEFLQEFGGRVAAATGDPHSSEFFFRYGTLLLFLCLFLVLLGLFFISKPIVALHDCMKLTAKQTSVHVSKDATCRMSDDVWKRCAGNFLPTFTAARVNLWRSCIIYATADEADAYMFYRCFCLLRPPQKYQTTVLGNGWTDFHEIFTKR